MYEMEDADAWINDKGGIQGVEEERKRLAEGEKGKMQEANVRDKEEAKEKKREKKRKRKEREKAVSALPFVLYLKLMMHCRRPV
jgi:ATP-dependent RNA helicase DDX10/DBP4